MKKKLCAALFALLLLTAGIAQAAAPLTAADFELTYAGAAYTLGADPAALLAAMTARDGAAPEVIEADSCIFTGKDKEFYGAELVLGTYPTGKNGGDQLETIVITAVDIPTARGVGVGSARDQVTAAYGPGLEDYDTLLYAIHTPYESPTLIFQFDLDSDTVVAVMLMACSA
ncbi:MAG: hypothetical protein IJ662_12140 [Clostridia bacterium]|nr:hypothetical protein [Clostridia bacterium]